jgi:DNA-directed RNA polymerase specialized sigma24 family protein
LPDDLRIVFVACVVGGMTRDRLAGLFAVTSETVEARMHNARSLLVEVVIRQSRPALMDRPPPSANFKGWGG